MALVMTKAALALKHSESDVQVVKFESYKPKVQSEKNVESTRERDPVNPYSKKEMDLKKIRHEVVKFGMSGFDGSKKEEAKIALAVSLGAKPPKREYVNYKELMQKRKQEKQKEREDKQAMISKSILHGTGKKKKKQHNNDVGHFLSGYGKVQKKDLKKAESEREPKTKRRRK